MFKRFSFHEVEGVRVGRIGTRLNTTCIVYRIGSDLIDTGPPNQWKLISTFISEKNVKRLWITHHHEDHGGNAGRIQSQHEAEVFIHKDGVPIMEQGFPMEYYRYIVWGKPVKMEPRAWEREMDLDFSMRLKPFHTPGHSVDSSCYLEPDRGWLFSGDLYIASRPVSMALTENPLQQIESLEFLLSLDFEVLFCAHRGIVQNGKEAVRSKLDYMRTLRDKIFDLNARGLSEKEITRRVLGKEDITSYITLFSFSKRNFVRNFLKFREQINE